MDVEVAIKLLAGAATDPHSMQTLRNEVLVARKIQHPNIIRVHDVFSDGHDAFFTMALVTGRPLCERLLSSVGPASYDKWNRQLLEAVLACQSAGIHHGDIKPDNILITDDDDLMLIDFGIGHSLSTQQHTSGHLQYAAPEVINNGISTLQSDTYSAGMVLQEVLAAVPVKQMLWDWRWRQKRQRNNARLTHPHPEQRPKLSNVLKEPESSNTQLRNPLTVGLLLVFLVGVIVTGLSRSPAPHTPTLPEKTLQLALLHDEQYPLLGTMTRLLRYPMALHPDLALVPAATSKQLIQNLALQPLQNDQDRLNLATTLDADLILTLELTPANTGQYLLHATMILMPANDVIFTQTQEVASGDLATHLEQFSTTLIDTLFAQLTTPVALPDLTYLEALTALDTATTFGDALAQLQQQAPDYPGTWLATAQYAADNNDIAQSREALSTLANFSDLHPYWKLQGNLLTAQLNDDLPLAQQSIQALVEAYPDRPELLATRADINQWANNLAAAEQDYQRAIELQPHNGQWLFQLARLQILRGDFAAALDKTLTKALVAFRRSKDPMVKAWCSMHSALLIFAWQNMNRPSAILKMR
ncbi:protein kinase domain-containing protein [Salinimonas marina]|uniref:protein kinase domain-containing protein n=1 Tax=Salinimonas marina TaxID=2785918 RepID=UPI001E3739A5|nr:protein kinase [Salinimonas marina]